MTKLTLGEQEYLGAVRTKVRKVAELLKPEINHALDDSRAWYSYLTAIKFAFGNLDNDISFVGVLMAKEYLLRTLEVEPLDVSTKPQGAPGLDIDGRTVSGERIVGELKTTFPYGALGLGAKQKSSFRKDFVKLQKAKAVHKYFFVTERKTFEIAIAKYRREIPGVKVVLLPDGPEEEIPND